MTNPMIRINDGNEIIDREMNEDELAQHLADVEYFKKKEADKLAKENAKAELLTKLGITAEEAVLLLS
jgi:hypothetical protein